MVDFLYLVWRLRSAGRGAGTNKLFTKPDGYAVGGELIVHGLLNGGEDPVPNVKGQKFPAQEMRE